MNRLFAACDLGEESGRIFLGTLQRDKLTLSEVQRFANAPSREKGEVHWDIAQLYQDTLAGLRAVGLYDEPVDSISCTSWTADYLLFHADASFIPPTFHHSDPRTIAGRKTILSRMPWASLYEETGVGDTARSTLFQLAAENSRRLKRADHLMPVADGFNFLLSGVACVEMSSASATQLFNPATKRWSEPVLRSLGLPPNLLPPVIRPGTKLKLLRPELAQATGLDGTHIVASCSSELAATVIGLPNQAGDAWACLRLGAQAVLATELAEPALNPACRTANLSHTVGYHGTLLCHAETVGLRLLDECRAFWAQTDHALNNEVLAYLASTAEPLESLVNLADPRFATPGDVIAKLQACCRETGQTVPRKPGAIYRCLMESLAFLYRRTFDDLARATRREFQCVYLVSETTNTLLNHFIANALQRPVVIAPAHTAAIGNVIVQALAMGRIKSFAEARELVQNSFKLVTIHPHPAATWAPAYDRYLKLVGAPAAAIEVAEPVAV